MRHVTARTVRGLVLGLCLAMGLASWGAATARAITTPYADKPAAFCLDVAPYNKSPYGLVWDVDFAASLGAVGNQYIILDFCHSGGFVNNLEADNRFVAAATWWDQVGWAWGTPDGGSAFGKPFWEKINQKESVISAYSYAHNFCLDWQNSIFSDSGSLSTKQLTYEEGDLAFLFSSDAPGYIAGDVNISRAKAALLQNGWPDDPAVITTAYGQFDQAALGKVYAATKDPANAGKNIVVYIDDHGVSTDVLKSRHVGTRYDYEFIGSIYRGDDYDGDASDSPYVYGITEIWTRLGLAPFPTWPATSNDIYWNVVAPHPGWQWKVEGGYIKWYSPNPADKNTWLLSGTPYPFGFDCRAPHAEVDWKDWCFYQNPAQGLKCNDSGWPRPDGLDYGDGTYVFRQDTYPHLDPSLWDGWMSGGDGWILAPVPEPLGALSLLLACGGLARYVRRRVA